MERLYIHPLPRQTFYGSTLYYSQNGKNKKQEFPTDAEAREFGDVLEEEEKKINEQLL